MEPVAAPSPAGPVTPGPDRPVEVDVELAATDLVALAARSAGLPSGALVVARRGAPVVRAVTGDLPPLAAIAGLDGELVVPHAAAHPRTRDLPEVAAGTLGALVVVPVPGDPFGAVVVLHGPAPVDVPAVALASVRRFASVIGTANGVLARYDDLDLDRQRWELAVQAGGIGSFDWDLVTDRLDWDDELQALFGYTRDDFVPHIRSFRERVHPEDLPRTEAIIAEAVAVSGRFRAEYRVVRPDGTVRWAQARGQVTRDPDGRPVRMLGVAFDVSEAHQARTMVARTRDRLALLAAVSSALSDHRDPERAIAGLPPVLVPRLADFCIVSLVGDDGQLVDIGCADSDPALTEALEEYCTARLPALSRESWVFQAARTGRITVVPYPAAESIATRIASPRGRELLVRLNPAFCVCVPVRLRDRVLGVVTLFNRLDSGPFGPADQQVAAEAAARAAVALEAARSFQRQRRIAEALQRSLLTAPPVREPWQLEVGYLPSTDDLQVGGDWYDAFPVADDTVVVTVGDVMGHDSQAAARMGQLRSLLRGVFLGGTPGPAEALELADRGMARYGLPGSATAVVASLRALPEGGAEVEMSVAGHPPPFVVDAAGARAVEVLVDPPVGVRAGARRSVRLRLEPGQTLLCYTDGLIERRDEDIDVGLERLRAAASELGPEPAALVDGVVEQLVEKRGGGDDIALLAVRVAPAR